jgi:hypothetical protein
MSALGTKLRRAEAGIVLFWCPGCDSAHQIRVDPAFGSAWGFNGDGNAPTFTPSVLVRSGHFIEPQGKHCDRSGDPEWPCNCVCCHSFVTEGRIQFLTDCTHELAGQTVDLPDWPGWGGIQ